MDDCVVYLFIEATSEYNTPKYAVRIYKNDSSVCFSFDSVALYLYAMTVQSKAFDKKGIIKNEKKHRTVNTTNTTTEQLHAGSLIRSIRFSR